MKCEECFIDLDPEIDPYGLVFKDKDTGQVIRDAEQNVVTIPDWYLLAVSRDVYFEVFANTVEVKGLRLRPVVAAQAALRRPFDHSRLLLDMWKRYAADGDIIVYTQPGFDDDLLLSKLIRSMYQEATDFEVLYFEEHLKDKILQAVS